MKLLFKHFQRLAEERSTTEDMNTEYKTQSSNLKFGQ